MLIVNFTWLECFPLIWTTKTLQSQNQSTDAFVGMWLSIRDEYCTSKGANVITVSSWGRPSNYANGISQCALVSSRCIAVLWNTSNFGMVREMTHVFSSNLPIIKIFAQYKHGIQPWKPCCKKFAQDGNCSKHLTFKWGFWKTNYWGAMIKNSINDFLRLDVFL